MDQLNRENEALQQQITEKDPVTPVENPKAKDAAERVRKKNKGSMGRGSTILTGPSGVLGSTYQGSTLLGG
jgi:hypothetical protein